jgi:hypothetical protein
MKYLICARADSPFTSPGSVFTHCCHKCGSRLMMAASGQRFLKKHPDATPICMTCVPPGTQFSEPRDGEHPHDVLRRMEGQLTGSVEEILAEYETREPNFWQKRN